MANCAQTLSGLTKDCRSNMGGIKNVYLANRSDVTEITESDGKVSAITMASSAKFKQYAFRKGTGSMTMTLNSDPTLGVSFVSTELVLQFSRMETVKRVEMAALSQSELAAIVEDMNGTFWLLGRSEGVTSSAGTGQTGTARTDGNYYQLTLQDNDASWPLEVDADIVSGLVA